MSSAKNLPKTYKAAIVKEKGKPFELIDRELQLPQEGEILVKVLACGVCHSDILVKEEIMPVLPRIPGHEIVGEVVAIPAGEKHWKVGQRVGGGWHGGHCSSCNRCRKGDFMTCEQETVNGVMRDGGYAEYCTLRTEAVAAIPEDVDPAEAAPLLCAGVTTYNSLRNMHVLPGEVVAVQGLGGLGHLALQFSSKMGYKTVALSSSASKEKLAKSLGADIYIDGSKVDATKELNKLGGAKVIIATAPNPNVIAPLLGGLAPDGTLLILAVANDPIPVPPLALISKRARVQGWPSGTAADSEDTVAFAKHANIHCHVERFKLKDVDKAFDKMMKNDVKFRAVLTPAA